jgi:hypothetical protein
MKNSKLVIFALVAGFIIMGVYTVSKSMPAPKEHSIYDLLVPEFPYIIEKRFGGLQIKFKDTGEVFKPSNEEFYSKIESIDKHWAKEHLSLKGNVLTIKSTPPKTITLQSQKEVDFLRSYFGVIAQ